MDIRKILSWVALLGGEAIIITAFIFFKSDSADNIGVLNIVISSLIYGLFFVDILVPWVDLADNSQKKVGSLGLRWFFTWLYAVSAIALMFIVSLGNLDFKWSLILQCILLFLLVLGFIASLTASDKVEEVYQQELQNRNGINEMKSAMRDLKDRMSGVTGLPDSFKTRINSLEEDLRFVSPANNEEAYGLEKSFSNIVSDISFAISDFQMNEEVIESNLKKLERIFQNRKLVYSN